MFCILNFARQRHIPTSVLNSTTLSIYSTVAVVSQTICHQQTGLQSSAMRRQ